MRGSPAPRRLLFALACGLATTAFSAGAFGYCRTKTCALGKTKDEARAQCEQQDGCISEGAALHWATPCLRYAVQLDGSPRNALDADQVAKLVEEAFLLWQSADCPHGGQPRFQAVFQGFVTCDQQEAVCAGADGNVNVVMFHDDVWPHDANELGITTPAAGTQSGLISDADIEINSQAFAAPTSMFELFPVMAHEVGHFLGLAHSNSAAALMSVSYESLGVSGQLLTADDVAGICAIYPPFDAPLTCTAPALAYDSCANPDPLEECSIATVRHASDGGCSVSRSRAGRAPAPLLVAVLGLGWLLRPAARRRAIRRTSRGNA